MLVNMFFVSEVNRYLKGTLVQIPTIARKYYNNSNSW